MSATFEDLMREQLLVPLGMESTVFYHEAAEEYEGFATPYVWDTSLGGNPENLTELPFETFRYILMFAILLLFFKHEFSFEYQI